MKDKDEKETRGWAEPDLRQEMGEESFTNKTFAGLVKSWEQWYLWKITS